MDTTYLTQLDASSTATVIERVLSRHCYEVDQGESAGYIHVTGRSARHCFCILIRAQPHLLRWIIHSDRTGTHVRFASRYAKWYATILSFIVPLSLLFWYVTIRQLLAPPHQGFDTATTRLVAFVLSFSSVFPTVHLIFADGSQSINKVTRAIRSKIGSCGHEFERRNPRTWSRHEIFSFVYLVLLLASAVTAVIRSGFVVTQGLQLTTVMVSVPLVASLVGILLIVGLRPGASERCVTMLPALSGVVALDILLGTLVVPFMVGRGDYDQWVQAITEYPDAVRLAAMSFVIFPVIAGLFVAFGLRIPQEVVRVESDTKILADASRAKATMSATGFLTQLRAALIVVWITLAGPLVIVTSMSLIAFGRWALTKTDTGPVAATSWIVASILDSDVTDSTVLLVTNAGWISLFLIVLVPFAFSLGQFSWRINRFHRWASRCTRGKPYTLVREVVAELASTTEMEPPRVIILPISAGHISAQVIGFRRADRVIMLGADCIDSLDANELRALIAHEMAHHVNGDCVRHALLQFLARLTLMGDGFVAVLEHSLQYEMNADRTAIRHFGIRPPHLASCIRKMSALGTLEKLHAFGGLELRDAVQKGKTRGTSLRRKGVWSSLLNSVRLWWRCYTCDTEMGYWHPSLPDRLALLESMTTGETNHHTQELAGHA